MTRRSAFLCAICPEYKPANKRNNVEQHVWQHHPNYHGQNKKHKYRASEHKKYVNSFVVRIRYHSHGGAPHDQMQTAKDLSATFTRSESSDSTVCDNLSMSSISSQRRGSASWSRPPLQMQRSYDPAYSPFVTTTPLMTAARQFSLATVPDEGIGSSMYSSSYEYSPTGWRSPDSANPMVYQQRKSLTCASTTNLYQPHETHSAWRYPSAPQPVPKQVWRPF